MGLNQKFKNYNRCRISSDKTSFCWAPWVGIHFSFNGKVYLCQNNNSFAIGQIGETNLKEIWNSKERKKYQKYLKHNKLAKVGCLQCLNDINQNNFNAVNASRYEAFSQYKTESFPSIMGFRFSDRCNIKCIMCMSNHKIRKSNFNHNTIYNDKFFSELRAFIPHLKYAYFSGGEPLYEPLNYIVFKLFAELNPKCKISLQTNGTILNDDIRTFLKNGNYDINVSIDSLNAKTFESIRYGAKHNIVMNNLKEFREICQSNNTQFSSCVTPMRMNWEELPDIIKYYSTQLKSTIWINKYYFPVQYALWALNATSLREIINKLSQHKFTFNDEIGNYNATQYAGYLNVLTSYLESALEREKEAPNLHFEPLIKNYIKQLRQTTKRYSNLCEAEELKINNIFNTFSKLPSKKLFYYLKTLLTAYSGDKLTESLLYYDSDFIINDINHIQI
jgi:radical SAM protein with 4Fe4S-binding SPASM domain